MTAAHGTYPGWNQHRREGTPICPDCREAARQYQAERRQRPEARARDYADNAARIRALWRLARMHPGQFAELVADEKTKTTGLIRGPKRGS